MLKWIFIIGFCLGSALFAGEVKTIDGHTYSGLIRFEDDQITVKTRDDLIRLTPDQVDQANFNPATPAPKNPVDHSPNLPAGAADNHGWLGSYYGDPALGTLLWSRLDPDINFDWGGKRPDSKMTGGFSVSWMGVVTAPTSGDYKFNLVCHGGIRVTIDGKLVIDRWKGNAGETNVILPMQAGKHVTMLIEYTTSAWDAGCHLLWSGPNFKKVPVPVDAVMPPGSQQRRALRKPRGLLGQYFDDETFTTERLRRHDANLNFRTIITDPLTWPDPLLPEKFAARWTGKLISPGDGTYNIIMNVDDVARLYLDGKPIIDCWQQHSGQYQASFAFHAGQTYDFKLEYSNRVGKDAALQLLWNGPRHHMEPIDAASFSPPPEETAADPIVILKPPTKPIYLEGESIDLFADTLLDEGEHVRQVDFLVDDKVIGSATQSPYVCHWSNPLQGQHQVMARAVDARGLRGQSARYRIIIAGKAPATLGDGWMDFRIGDPGGPGDSLSAQGNQITVAAAPGDVWSTTDGFHYIFHPLEGDGSLTAELVSLHSDGASDLSTAGLMIRKELTPNSAHALLMGISNPQPSVMFLHRDWPGGEPAYTSATGKPPTWFRIERVGNHIRSYLSTNGEHWTPVGEADIQPGDTMYIGLAVTGKGAAHSAAVFDHVELHAGTTLSQALPAGLQEINGTVLAGQVLNADADKVQFQFHGKIVEIKTADVARLLFRSLPAATVAGFDPGKKGVALDTGDIVEGEDIDFHAGHVWVSSVLFGKQNFGLETARAMLINDPKPANGGYTITVADGSVYQSPKLLINGDKLEIDDPVAGAIAFNSTEVRIIFRSPAKP
jgi:hypothetical protein